MLDDLISEFIAETSEGLELVDKELIELESNPNKSELIDDIFRILHSIKGTCGFFGLDKLASIAHSGEEIISKIRSKTLAVDQNIISLILEVIDSIKTILIYVGKNGKEPEIDFSELIQKINKNILNNNQNIVVVNKKNIQEIFKPEAISSTIRVNVKTLEKLMQSVTELVLNRNELVQLNRESPNTKANLPIYKLNSITSLLQESVMETRLQSISYAWRSIPKMLRNLSIKLDKKIKLETFGASTRLDKQLIDGIRDPIAIMVRNAADHGIESVQERIAANKPEEGVLSLNAYHNNGHVVIEVSDDGRGMDVEKIKIKILENKLATEQELMALTDQQIIQYIFNAGISTSKEVTDVSGRGVGMDVIKKNIEELQGTIEIKSVKGKGSTIIVSVPLTLAIMSVLVIESSGQKFAIPQINIDQVIEVRRGSKYSLRETHGQKSLEINGQILPCVELNNALQLKNVDQENKFVVICNVRGLSYGLIVDKVNEIEEIVLKPLSKLIKNIGMYNGNTLLGKGDVVMVLNPNNLTQKVSKLDYEGDTQEKILSKQYLLFSLSGKTKAISLDKVSSIKEIDISMVEKLKSKLVINNEERVLLLVVENKSYKLPKSGKQLVIILQKGSKEIGLLVDKVFDVISNYNTQDDVITIDNNIIEILDCNKIIKKA